MQKPKYLEASGGQKYCPKHDLFFAQSCWNCAHEEKQNQKPAAASSSAAPTVVATGGK